MLAIEDRQAKLKIRKRRQEYRLPYTAHERLNTSHSALSCYVHNRSWALPKTLFKDEIMHYSDRHKALKISGPRPTFRKSIDKEHSEELAIKIDTSLNFAALAETADELIKPILLYYSCAHLCGVFSRAFFNWEKDNRTHGITCNTCNYETGNVGQTVIKVEDSGMFPRIAAFCFLLTGHPNCFSTLVTYSSSPTHNAGRGELLEHFGKEEVGNPKVKMTLDELVNFNYGSELKKVRERHGYHKFKGLPTTAFLLDLLTLFVGSSLARYDVLGWKQILEGNNNPYRIHFEDAFDRYQSFTIDAVLARLDEPFLDFDNRLIPSQPSPYSHRDRSRFGKNPNYEQQT